MGSTNSIPALVANATTTLADGLTTASSPTTTVGTVSLPPACRRTSAAAAGSAQMSISRVGTPARRSWPRNDEQNGQPGRQYTTTSGDGVLFTLVQTLRRSGPFPAISPTRPSGPDPDARKPVCSRALPCRPRQGSACSTNSAGATQRLASAARSHGRSGYERYRRLESAIHWSSPDCWCRSWRRQRTARCHRPLRTRGCWRPKFVTSR